MAPHSSTFAWKIPWMEEPGGLHLWDRSESDTTERLHFHFSLSCIEEGNGNPLQCSSLKNPRDGGAWWAAVSGVAQSWTPLKRLSSSSDSSRSLRLFFLYDSSVYSYKLFLTSSASFRSSPFLFFIVPIFVWNIPLVSLIFVKRSLVFPIVLFSSISLHCSLRKAFLSLLAILWNSAVEYIFPFPLCLLLLFFSQLFVRPPQTTILPSDISFSMGWFWSLPPVQCYEIPSVFLQALCLSDLIPWIYLSLPLWNHSGFDSDYTWMA